MSLKRNTTQYRETETIFSVLSL